jgi:predicted nucleic acid-binding protein
METVTQQIQKIIQPVTNQPAKIGLDTNCVQYYLNDISPWADCLQPIFQAALSGKVELYVSIVVVSELIAHVHLDSRNEVGYDPEFNLLAILNCHFQILDVTEDIAKAAGRLRASHASGKKLTLKTPDALIGATSLTSGHKVFITNDEQLANALSNCDCIYLKDLALEWLEQNFAHSCLVSSRPIPVSKTTSGIVGSAILAEEICSIKPHIQTTLDCILFDASITAVALNEPCLFFVLVNNVHGNPEIEEVLFWHNGFNHSRPIKNIKKYLTKHLKINNNKQIYTLCFASLDREFVRQNQRNFASKTPRQKKAEAWKAYLSILWSFQDLMRFPQTAWLFCENGNAQQLNTIDTLAFLNQASKILGWKEEK